MTRDGQTVSGIVNAFDEYSAVAQIKETADIVLKVTPIKEKNGLLTMEIGSKKIKGKDIAVLCSQFSIILKAGMPIADCVNLVAKQCTEKRLKLLLEQAADDVASGMSLASSFETHGKDRLPVTFIETIRAGEESGTLDRSFEIMEKYFSKRDKTAAKIKGALTYPIFVLCIAVVVVIIVMIKVVPTITEITSELGGDLPLMTKMLIAMSNFFRDNILIIVAVVAFAAICFKYWTSNEDGKMTWSRIQLKIPILGNIRVLNAASQFANTLSALSQSGLSLPKAISVTAKTMDSYALGKETEKMISGIEEGRQLGACIKDIEGYPDTLKEMTAIGEETGELEATLATIGAYYDNEAEMATKKAVDKLEPFMICVLALIAGFIVLSIYLPIFSMYGQM